MYDIRPIGSDKRGVCDVAQAIRFTTAPVSVRGPSGQWGGKNTLIILEKGDTSFFIHQSEYILLRAMA